MSLSLSWSLEPALDEGFRRSARPRNECRGEISSPLDIDTALVRLAVLEARSRVRLGRAAVRFLALRGHQRLGFVRAGDYTRERLGISGRELQSFAFVASRLRELRRLAVAFLHGEISWSQARLLCGVATAETEGAWLALARGAGVRELAISIRGRSAAATQDLSDALEDAQDETDGEERHRLTVPCPSRVTVLWRRALELARRIIGSPAPAWQAAEAIAAEAGADGAIVVSPSVEARQGEHPKAAGTRTVPKLERTAFDDEEIDECDLNAVAVEALDAFDLDLEMRLLVDDLRTVDALLGHALRRSVDLRAFRARGFAAFDDYVRERLGISPAKARALVMLDRRVREGSELGRAYLEGRLSWARALALLPVASGREERAWVARAGEVTVRRLHDEIDWTLDQRDVHGRAMMPPPHGARLEPPDLQTCAPRDGEAVDGRVTFFGPASVVGLFRAAVVSLSHPNEPRWKGLERLLRQAIAEWEAQPRHRDPIFARDGWRCAVPGCSSRRGLEDHHIEFRSHGGGNEQENRIAICAVHHHHAVHRHVVRARGRAPDDVLWELGLQPGREALLVLHGERYVSPSGL